MAADGARPRLVPNEDLRAMEWEVDVAMLKRMQNESDGHTAKLMSPEFTLHIPTPAGTQTFRCRAQLQVERGKLGFFFSLPRGTKARWCQWAGPRGVRVRVARDAWHKPDHFLGERGYIADDHAESGVLLLGFAVLFAFTSAGLQTLPDRFKLGRTLGSGSFGSVVEASDAETGRDDLVAKVSTQGEGSDFATEAVALQLLAGPGFPQFLGYYKAATGSKEMLIMQRLHRDLESLCEDPNVGLAGRLSAETVIEVGCQVIERLREMHRLGLVHMDMKPDNIMICDGQAHVVFLIDFGLSRHYTVAGHHFPPREAGLKGTARYCSVDAHKGLLSRRADVESLGHVLIYLAIGCLPWQGCQGSKREREAAILRKKMDPNLLNDHTRKHLAADPALADALLEMVKYCRALEFQAEPDYGHLQTLLRMARPRAQLGRIQSEQEITMNSFHGPPRLDWIAQDGSMTPASRHKAPATGFCMKTNNTAVATNGCQAGTGLPAVPSVGGARHDDQGKAHDEAHEDAGGTLRGDSPADREGEADPSGDRHGLLSARKKGPCVIG
eukprot:TRINITY_DN13982_c0_g1_i1.p1 TRINITY_DN13982_c0_g1~~TRINITY_DN13982_c0_g1_i1.p1  ORF type:complete len:555 (-),score=85.62 TRINITY_DN13982_c0_g1_i1:263-1927(-)